MVNVCGKRLDASEVVRNAARSVGNDLLLEFVQTHKSKIGEWRSWKNDTLRAFAEEACARGLVK